MWKWNDQKQMKYPSGINNFYLLNSCSSSIPQDQLNRHDEHGHILYCGASGPCCLLHLHIWHLLHITFGSWDESSACALTITCQAPGALRSRWSEGRQHVQAWHQRHHQDALFKVRTVFPSSTFSYFPPPDLSFFPSFHPSHPGPTNYRPDPSGYRPDIDIFSSSI